MGWHGRKAVNRSKELNLFRPATRSHAGRPHARLPRYKSVRNDRNSWLASQWDCIALMALRLAHVGIVVVVAIVALPFAMLLWTYILLSSMRMRD
jgi:hypothetical protein